MFRSTSGQVSDAQSGHQGSFIVFVKKGLYGFEADVLGLDPTGFNAPEVNGQESRTGNDGFLFSSGTCFGATGQYMIEFLQTPPRTVPESETPDRLDEHTSDSPVALAVDGAEASGASAGVFARCASDEAADFAPVTKTIPIEDLGLESLPGGLSEAGGAATVWCRFGGQALSFNGSHAGGGIEDEFAMAFEHGNQPGIKCFGEPGPDAGSPPAFRHRGEAVFRQQAATVSREHVADFEKLGALAPECAAAFLGRGRNTHDFELPAVPSDMEVEQFGAELQSVHAVGLAPSVEGLWGHNKTFDSEGMKGAVKSVAHAAGFLNADDGDPTGEKFTEHGEKILARILAYDLRSARLPAAHNHGSFLFHVETDVKCALSFLADSK